MPNRLINETSPYLLQHAHNPVDWYPWGEEALEHARKEDKPILLSIGYSACHWCHVMEHESFENEEIASIMNQHFVNIKVDREERPDLDAIYMQAVQAMTGHGGWPMTVFLTPDGKPFFGGTYFPPEDRGGMPGFVRVLRAVAEAYRTRRGEVIQSGQQLLAHMRQPVQIQRSIDPLTAAVLRQAFQTVVSHFDYQNGGTGPAPKFPQPMVYEFLLRYYHHAKDLRALEMVEMTLEKMARGGIYDQLGGGFHRYSTDNYWLVPHFEKMLYDNALLSRLYLHAYQATGTSLYRRITEETLDYVLREMTDPSGGFYSSQDADSEGEEGKYFVWTPEEIETVLGPEEGAIFCQYYGVTRYGNFEGKNILHVPVSPESLAAALGISLEKLEDIVQRGKVHLLERREQRVHPGKDDKVLVAWNGLMLRSFAEAACVLQRDDYCQAAVAAASFLLQALCQNGRLLRTYRDGQAKLKGYLEDYAFLIDGLLTLHEATFDQRWLDEASSLAKGMIELFWEEREGTFYDTGHDHESLVVRPRDIFDNATPCGSSKAADVLLRLGLLVGESSYTRIATTALRSMQPLMARYPEGLAHWLCALNFYLSQPKEIAIIGPHSSPATKALLEVIYGRFMPNKVVAGSEGSNSDVTQRVGAVRELPLLRGRSMLNDNPTVYVCQNYTCQAPVTQPDELAKQLEG